MTTILNQGGFGCIYYPSLSCSGKPTKKKNIVSKLQYNDFNARNEKNISEIIKTIKDYKMFFIPIQTVCSVSIQAMDPSVLHNCDAVDKTYSNDLILLDMDYEENISIQNILTPTPSLIVKKKKFIKLLETYKYLLSSIEKLLQVDIVHYDLKKQNILFSTKKNIPLIIDFGLSIPIKKINNDNISKWFYTYAPEYDIWPPEVHLLCYVIKNKGLTLSINDTNSIATSCVENNMALTIFSSALKDKYLESCKKHLAKYANKSYDDVKQSILKHYPTWDNYSISVMYLKILFNIFPRGFHYNKFLIVFSQLLFTNISPSIDSRKSVTESMKMYNDMFYEKDSVESFINIVEFSF